MKRISMKQKIVAGVAVGGLVLGMSGAAFAYWTTTGSGSGSATNASSNGTITLTAVFAGGLTPGGSKSVSVQAANTGTSNLFVTTVSPDSPAITIDGPHVTAGCLVGDFSLTGFHSTGGQVNAAASGVVVATDTLNMENTSSDQEGCKGAIITLHYTSV
jgi:hypothetical protein